MKIAALCDFPYWEGRVGTAVRMESLCQSLSKVCDLSVICSMKMPERYFDRMSSAPYTFIDQSAMEQVHTNTPGWLIPGVKPDRMVAVKGIKHIVETGGYDAVLTPYFNREWMVEHIRRDVLRIVDTIDCQSQRTRSFARHGMLPTFPMTPQEEGHQLDRYDLAIALSDEDQAELSTMTDRPIVTAPFRLPAQPIYSARQTASEVLFIAAKSDVNDMTLAYMLDEVLPLVGRPLTLHVVGNVTVPETRSRNVKLVHHENVDDLGFIYRAVDLALNPTYAGGGIKTKTLEAMAYGVPVLTSDEGARGLTNLLPDDLIINDKYSFAARIGALLDDPDRRAALSREMLSRMAAEDSESWLPTFVQLLEVQKARLQERLAS